MALGLLIRAFLDDNGLSLAEFQVLLASIGVEVSRMAISNWSRGQRPSERYYPALAQVLGISERDVVLAAHGLSPSSASEVSVA